MLHCILNLSISVGLCLQDGISPLYAASAKGHTDIVGILIKAGADIHQAATKVCGISSGKFNGVVWEYFTIILSGIHLQ